MIAEGRVSVNGARIDSPALNCDAGRPDRRGRQARRGAGPSSALALSQACGAGDLGRRQKGRRTVFDALPEGMPRVMTIGRLDLTSEGLLLLDQ